MACGGVAQNIFIEVGEEISGSDEVFFEFAAKSAIQAGENARGIVSVRKLGGESNFEHGGDERGGNSVASHVGDQNADAFFVEDEEIVEIAGDGAHGEVASGDVEASEGRNGLRERGGLNLLSDFELFLDGEEPLFVGEGAAGRDISEAADESEKAKILDVVAGN